MSRCPPCLDVFVLGAKRLGKSEQRPAVAWIAAQVLAVDGLGVGGASGLQELGTEQVAHREEPVGGLVVRELVLLRRPGRQELDGRCVVRARRGDRRLGDRRGERGSEV